MARMRCQSTFLSGRFLAAEAVADVREHVVHLTADGCQDDDHDERNKNEDERVLDHPLPFLVSPDGHPLDLACNELTASNQLGLNRISW
jgi:hypothetical protein